MTYDVSRIDDAMNAPPAEPPRTIVEDNGTRWWPHLVWDGTLLIVTLIAAAVALLFIPSFPDLGEVNDVSTAVMRFGPILLLATALAVSMRVGVPNLGVVGIAAFTPIIHSVSVTAGLDTGIAWLVTVGALLTIALVQALLVLLLRTAGWVVGLFTLLALTAVLNQLSMLGVKWNGEAVAWSIGLVDSVGIIAVSGAAVGIAIGVGVLFSLKGIRAKAEACAAASDGNGRRTGAGGVLTVIALVVSNLLAGAAGLVAQNFPVPLIDPSSLMDVRTINLLLFVLAIVLVGGATTRGRGGVVGVVFATALLLAAEAYLTSVPEASHAYVWLGVSALLLGLIVNAFLIVLGRAPTLPAGTDTSLETLMTDDATAESAPAATPTLTIPAVDSTVPHGRYPTLPDDTIENPVVAEPTISTDAVTATLPAVTEPTEPEPAEQPDDRRGDDDPLPARPDSTVTLASPTLAPVAADGPMANETPPAPVETAVAEATPETEASQHEEPVTVETPSVDVTAVEPVTAPPAPTDAPESPAADDVEDSDTVVIRPRQSGPNSDSYQYRPPAQ
ncbi:hypothetical protein [Stackebrandtia soli]|uniref:hypothetical protein n=1 Tax=Stackebrandtia soli TaxID=1892856 RepID=UPI0039ECFC26